MDDEGLRDDIPIGVRAHRGIILKKIDALRAAADTAATAPSLLMNVGPASAAVAASNATGGVSDALAVAKRELAASQQENAALREALAGDRLTASPTATPLLLGNTNGPTPGAASVPSLSNSGVTVRLSIRKPTGDYIKVEVGEQTLVAELKAELSNLTGMPLRTQVRTAFGFLRGRQHTSTPTFQTSNFLMLLVCMGYRCYYTNSKSLRTSGQCLVVAYRTWQCCISSKAAPCGAQTTSSLEASRAGAKVDPVLPVGSYVNINIRLPNTPGPTRTSEVNHWLACSRSVLNSPHLDKFHAERALSFCLMWLAQRRVAKRIASRSRT